VTDLGLIVTMFPDSSGRSGNLKVKILSTAVICMPLLLNWVQQLCVGAVTVAEQQEIVSIHNAFRRGEGSSNMQIMVSLDWSAIKTAVARATSHRLDA
jgi:hypothetical protein